MVNSFLLLAYLEAAGRSPWVFSTVEAKGSLQIKILSELYVNLFLFFF